jgi:TatD DNase family protein
MVIDSHAHLYDPQYDVDRNDVLRRAAEAGVEAIIVPGTTVETSAMALDLARRHPGLYACVGIHPHDASTASPAALETIERLSREDRVVAIGEIGLDYHYNLSPRDAQRDAFRAQIEIAVRRNLPIVVHTRESVDEAIAMVEEGVRNNPQWKSGGKDLHTRYPALRGVFHCFPGSADQVWRLLELGFLVSYPGIVTFKNSSVAETVKAIGFDHILLETDSPYLAPVPHRGKRNEPSHVILVAQKIAEIVGADVGDVMRTTRTNTKKLFGIGPFDPPQIAYQLRDSLYLNITLRCNADCFFCDRKGEAVVKGHNLKIDREPTANEVIEAIVDPTRYSEVVFCGYGEPTIRLDVIKEVAAWIKKKGGTVRLNTDGHGNVIQHRNIVPELVGLVDAVSISLNSIDPDQYGQMMRLDGQKFHKAMVDFARECVRLLPEVTMTVVGMNEVDTKAAEDFVKKEIGAHFRVRPYF